MSGIADDVNWFDDKKVKRDDEESKRKTTMQLLSKIREAGIKEPHYSTIRKAIEEALDILV